MSVDVEYGIRKDVRNNPVVREVDLDQKREFLRTLRFAALIVAMLLFWAWQQFKLVRNGYETSALSAALAEATAQQRRLRLDLESLRAPAEIERRARDLGLVTASEVETLVLERVRPAPPARAVVAEVR